MLFLNSGNYNKIWPKFERLKNILVENLKIEFPHQYFSLLVIVDVDIASHVSNKNNTVNGEGLKRTFFEIHGLIGAIFNLEH